MDLKITSEKIANPLLVELLGKLTDSFNRMGREFYVIGATARDIIIRQLDRHLLPEEGQRIWILRLQYPTGVSSMKLKKSWLLMAFRNHST